MILRRRAAVTGSSNHCLVGLNGTVIDETKHMLVLQTAKGPRWIPKQGSTLLIGGQYVSGEELHGRLHERLTGP